jgi:hypothetical protein
VSRNVTAFWIRLVGRKVWRKEGKFPLLGFSAFFNKESALKTLFSP